MNDDGLYVKRAVFACLGGRECLDCSEIVAKWRDSRSAVMVDGLRRLKPDWSKEIWRRKLVKPRNVVL
jgi:hypothetical protein